MTDSMPVISGEVVITTRTELRRYLDTSFQRGVVRGALEAASVITAPWDDCKVAYGIDDLGAFEVWMASSDDEKDELPVHWTFVETDTSGARAVAVFRIDGIAWPSDGRAVLETLRRAGAIIAGEPTQ